MFSRRVLRIKVMQRLFAFFMQEKAVKSSVSAYRTGTIEGRLQGFPMSLEQEVAKIQNFFIHALQLLVVWARMDQEEVNKMLIGRLGSRLADNRVIQLLGQQSIFASGASSTYTTEEVRARWYHVCLKKSAVFVAYCKKKSHGYDEDKRFVVEVMKKVIFKHVAIQKDAALQDISWSENKFIVERLLLSFIDGLTSDTLCIDKKTYVLKPSEEEYNFYERLIKYTLAHKTIYEGSLSKKLKNWELDRITELDKLLIVMTLAELVHFREIPRGVVINEYLDIAKKYSTPKSHLFINGVVESVSSKL